METDAELTTARAALGDLEGSHEALAHMIRRPPPDGEARIEVVLFGRRSDYMEIAGQERVKDGFYTSRLPVDVEPRPVLVIPDRKLAEDVRETFQHELSHRFLHERFTRLPPWLDEGLAQYYSTLRTVPGRAVFEGFAEARSTLRTVPGWAVFGGPLASLKFMPGAYSSPARHGSVEQIQIPIVKAPTVRQLIEADPSMFYVSGPDESTPAADRERRAAFFGAAYQLVLLLHDDSGQRERGRFTAFLHDIERGMQAREAFLARFGGDWPALERAFRAYLGDTRNENRRHLFPYQPFAIAFYRERALSDTEVHLLWARLLSQKQGGLDRAKREVDEARAESPASPEARYLRAMLLLHERAFEEARTDMDAALAARPEDPRYLLAALKVRWAQREAAGSDAPPSRDLMDRRAPRLQRPSSLSSQRISRA